MRAVLSDSIYIPEKDIEPYWGELHSLLHVPNHEKEEAKRAKRYGWWDMPDEVELWDHDGSNVVLPRGVRDPLFAGFEALGVDVEVDDRRTNETVRGVWPAFPRYRSFQRSGSKALIDAQEGIVEAPAGSGKSVLGLEVVRRARQARNIIIVNEIGIARQWLKEAHDFLGEGFGYGLIGGGEWSEGRLTIATEQTLYARREQLDRDGWWAKWGVSILDECHHATARTFIEVMSRFPSLIRGGLSATPDKTGSFEFALAVLGDVVHRTTRHQLREEGILMRPEVRVVTTPFGFQYWPDHQVTKAEGYECLVPGCPKSGRERHGHRNNYQKMLSALVADPDRNLMIAEFIRRHRGDLQIVMSKQTKQLTNIRRAMEALEFDDEVFWLIGDTTDDARAEVKDRMMSERSGVLLTTIADEAFNCPPLRIGHMPFPTKNLGAIRQRAGRIERAWPAKEDPILYDYRDPVGPLARHASERRWGVYAEELYTVVQINNGEEDVRASWAG